MRRPSAFGVGLTVLALFCVAALLGPAIAPYGLHEQVGGVFQPPSWSHPLGTDDAGRDVLSLCIGGARVSMVVAVAASFVAIAIGASIGVIAGYSGGLVDGVLMRITDYFLVVPALPLMIVISTVWGPSLWHVVLVIGALLWTPSARVLRAEVLTVRERSYVLRVRAMGASRTRIIVHHVLPQVRALIAANCVLTISVAIFFESALAFLGLESADTVSWGTMIADAFRRAAASSGAWWAFVPPGICIAIVVLACNLVGSAVEDRAGTRLRAPRLSRTGFAVADRTAGEDA
ncbi:MAG: ABC transporter permease [Actinobacteria bacterium]|nr:ABC transporter permease [Actinomycetota bacterium]